MIKKLEFCVLVLSCAAAYEMSDGNRAFGMYPNTEENYNNENYDYQGLGPYRPEIPEDPVLSRLFNSLHNRDGAGLHIFQNRPKSETMENPLSGYRYVPFSELLDLKDDRVKRNIAETAKVLKEKLIDPKQPIDDVKKVRQGLLWVCYPKMCSFRLPRPSAPA